MASVSCTSHSDTTAIFEASISSDIVKRILYIFIDGRVIDSGEKSGPPLFVMVTGLSPGTTYDYSWEIDYYTANSWHNGGSGTGTITTDGSSGGGGGGTNPDPPTSGDYTWDCYNLTSGSYMGYETSTSASSINAPYI